MGAVTAKTVAREAVEATAVREEMVVGGILANPTRMEAREVEGATADVAVRVGAVVMEGMPSFITRTIQAVNNHTSMLEGDALAMVVGMAGAETAVHPGERDVGSWALVCSATLELDLALRLAPMAIGGCISGCP